MNPIIRLQIRMYQFWIRQYEKHPVFYTALILLNAANKGHRVRQRWEQAAKVAREADCADRVAEHFTDVRYPR